MDILKLLLIAHLIGDFFLQPVKLVEQKKNSIKGLIIHTLIYTLMIVLVLFLGVGYAVVSSVYLNIGGTANVANSELKVLRFDKADKEWLDFVSVNRKGQCQETYDIVIGPVADDGVYEVVRFYEIGVYDLEEALKRLKVEELYNQVLFHTEKSLTYLKFIGTEEK